MTALTDELAEELRTAVAWTRHGIALGWRRVRRSEAGEGVISAAIAVLVMAFMGAAMWFAFSRTMNTTQSKVDTNVNQLGSNSGGGGTGGVGGSGTGGTGTGAGGTGGGGSGTGGTAGP
jgi:hypothetical protein